MAALLRFNSSALADAEALTSLDDYMARAPEGQKTIWYVTAPNREAARLNPHMEIFRKKGIEALFLFEPVDEFVMDGLGSYKDWEFKAVETAADDALAAFEDKEKPEAVAPLSEDDSASFDGLMARMKEILGAGKKPSTILGSGDVELPAGRAVETTSLLAPAQAQRKCVLVEGDSDDKIAEFCRAIRTELQ